MARVLASSELLDTPPPTHTHRYSFTAPSVQSISFRDTSSVLGWLGTLSVKALSFQNQAHSQCPFWSSEMMHLTEFDILDIYAHNQKHLFTRKPEVGCDLGGIRIFTMRLNVLQLRNGKWTNDHEKRRQNVCISWLICSNSYIRRHWDGAIEGRLPR